MIIGPDRDIPAPDVGTDGQHMAWMMDTFSQERGFAIPGVVTGKPVEIGGSLGRAESTGRGVVYTIQHAAKHLAKIGKPAPKIDWHAPRSRSTASVKSARSRRTRSISSAPKSSRSATSPAAFTTRTA